jgi:hypothetical protein
LNILTGERVDVEQSSLMVTTALKGSASLKFDRTAARNVDQSARARLVETKKLVLVCDLDATLIHATTERDLARHGDLGRVTRLAAAQQRVAERGAAAREREAAAAAAERSHGRPASACARSHTQVSARAVWIGDTAR